VEHGAPRFTHTAIDDLESFLWILFWVPLELYHIKFKKHLYPEYDWRKSLNSASIQVQAAKGNLVQELTVAIKTKKPLGYIKLFYDLIVQWQEIALEGRIEVEQVLQVGQAGLDLDFHKKYYERYLDVGFQFLGNIPDTWNV
jgi:hypothetical protein